MNNNNKRQREIFNPYLAHQEGNSRKSKQDNSNVNFRRKKRDMTALVFQGKVEEEEAEEEHKSSAGARSEVIEEDAVVMKNEEDEQVFNNEPFKNLETPAMEWWDIVFLNKETKAKIENWTPETAPYHELKTSNLNYTVYVEHPVPVQPTRASINSDEPLKLYKTKKELKKQRRIENEAKNRDKIDQITLGLRPAPQPRITYKSFLTAAGTEQVAVDPSLFEKRIQEELAQRKTQHNMRNLANKLTPQEKIEKKRLRRQKDAKSPTVHVAVFRVTNLNCMEEDLAKKRMGTMSKFCKDWLINGRAIVVAAPLSIPTVVFVEGGPKAIQKFQQLMLKRVNWSSKTMKEEEIAKSLRKSNDDEQDDEESSDSSESSSSSSNSSADQEEEQEKKEKLDVNKPKKPISSSCSLVWSGISAGREFDFFKRQVFESELDVKLFLKQKNLSHIWDLAMNED